MSQFGSAPGPFPPSNPYGQRPGAPYASPQPAKSDGENQLGMLALLCGVLSFFMGCPLSIAAIVMGWMAMKKEPKGMATAGFVIGIASLVLQLLVGCVVVGIWVAAAGTIAAVGAAVGPSLETVNVLGQAQAKIQEHRTANQTWPTDAEGAAMVVGVNDGWGNPITYRLDPDRDYVVASAGPDGIAGNDDDVEADSSYIFGEDTDSPEYGTATEDAIYEAADAIEVASEDSDTYVTDAVGGPVIAHLKDEWGNSLTYRQTDGGDSYLIISPGPDGILDTPDDVTDEDLY